MAKIRKSIDPLESDQLSPKDSADVVINWPVVLESFIIKRDTLLSKVIFCEVIENLRQQVCFDRKIGSVLKEAFCTNSEYSYKDDLAIKTIMKLLQVFFPKDKDGFCEIEHHCFYLEFGNISGENLITSEDLYDKLVSQKK
jgi:hypothetical protein